MQYTASERSLFDAGVLIGALLRDDPRHAEAVPLVESARRGDLAACTTTSILSEVYAALTWVGAQPPHTPSEAATAVLRLFEPPSGIAVLRDGPEAAAIALQLAERHGLTARRIHDARHAATALACGVGSVYTYDVSDWAVFLEDGNQIAGPPSMIQTP